ncbi:MAG: NAD kinase [Bacteroidetes bacterium HGW-Bacteroidetes-17]|jgi:NAD+ kinase|nr:MAG: NAD kinase [Bacteroidetes bacterium HGW-Bacteroidetes-17]
MRIALFGMLPDQASMPYIQQLIRKLEEVNCSILVYGPYFEKFESNIIFIKPFQLFNTHEELVNNVDYLLSIGGDGTFLDTVRLIKDSGVPVLGINMGRLGFLSSISKDEISDAVNALVNKDFKLVPRILVKLITKEGLFGDLNYGLNEVSIRRRDSSSLMVLHVYVDGEMLNSYWADGLIIATPTGSTAYSLSCGGPILTPGSKNFVITPIATHNLTVRPFVIPDDSKIRIELEGRNEQFLVSLDSRTESIDKPLVLNIEKETFNINLIQMSNKNFFSTIRDKLKWGLDIRN